MIGKVIIGKSFRGCLLYCLNHKKQEANEDEKMKSRAEVLMFNQCGGTERELIRHFNEVRALNMRVSKPVLHITLSLAEVDKTDREKLIEISEACAKEMDFSSNQWVAILHHDTNHLHLHLVSNRIGFDGRTVSDSNSYKRIALFCRKMEEKYNLTQVLNPRAFQSKKERELPRLDKRKEQLQNHIKQCLSIAHNYREFEELMKRKNITVEKSRGIAFTDDKKMRVKGSELGYSLSTIERILAKKQGLSLGQTLTAQYDLKQDNRQVIKSINEKENRMGLSTGRIATAPINRLLKAENNSVEPIAKELIEETRKKSKRLRL